MKVIKERRENGSLRVYTLAVDDNGEKRASPVQQQFKDQVNINNIMKKHKIDYNKLPEPIGVYADFSEVTDYRGMVQKVKDGATAFDRLPSHIRKRFENDPAALFEFLSKSENKEEGIKLGLIRPDPVKQPDPSLEALKEIATNTKKKTKVIEVD